MIAKSNMTPRIFKLNDRTREEKIFHAKLRIKNFKSNKLTSNPVPYPSELHAVADERHVHHFARNV